MTKPNTLAQYGVTMAPKEFGEYVFNRLKVWDPTIKSSDDLLVNPEVAMHFCRHINSVFCGPGVTLMPDNVILRALIAFRKSGKAKGRLGRLE